MATIGRQRLIHASPARAPGAALYSCIAVLNSFSTCGHHLIDESKGRYHHFHGHSGLCARSVFPSIVGCLDFCLPVSLLISAPRARTKVRAIIRKNSCARLCSQRANKAGYTVVHYRGGKVRNVWEHRFFSTAQ